MATKLNESCNSTLDAYACLLPGTWCNILPLWKLRMTCMYRSFFIAATSLCMTSYTSNALCPLLVEDEMSYVSARSDIILHIWRVLSRRIWQLARWLVFQVLKLMLVSIPTRQTRFGRMIAEDQLVQISTSQAQLFRRGLTSRCFWWRTVLLLSMLKMKWPIRCVQRRTVSFDFILLYMYFIMCSEQVHNVTT